MISFLTTSWHHLLLYGDVPFNCMITSFLIYWTPTLLEFPVSVFFGLSVKRPKLMMRLKLISVKCTYFDSRISLWNVQKSWFPLKSVSILVICNLRLLRQTCEKLTHTGMLAFRKTLTRDGDSLVVKRPSMPNMTRNLIAILPYWCHAWFLQNSGMVI